MKACRGAHCLQCRTLSSSSSSSSTTSNKTVEVPMSYCVPPPPGQQLGLEADKVTDPGLPVFSFHRQHGRWPLAREPDVDPARFAAMAVVPQTQTVRDARALASAPTLADYGFQLVPSPRLDANNVFDDEYVEHVYYKHVCELVRHETGATLVLPYDHVRRRAGGATEPSSEQPFPTVSPCDTKGYCFGPPAYLVHADSADRSWQWRVAELLAAPGEWDQVGPATVPERFARAHLRAPETRWAIVNAWRHVGMDDALESTPLALLDPRTVNWDGASDEVMRYAITMGDAVAFNFVLGHSPSHAWYYFPSMTKDELLLFKAFEQNSEKITPFSLESSSEQRNDRRAPVFEVLFHSAFDLPAEKNEQDAEGCVSSTTKSASTRSPRVSLEVRCVVVWA